jgi:serine/threonine protein kinase
MEMVKGKDLQAKQRSMGQSSRIGMQILRGLRAIHFTGQRHNDLHPGNVMMDGDDAATVRVVDVGNAVPISSPAVGGGYHAPEQKAVGVTSDIYSAGAMLYFSRLGEAPGRPPDLNKIPEPQLRAVLAKAMHADPRQRFQNAQEFMEALRPLSAAQ